MLGDHRKAHHNAFAVIAHSVFLGQLMEGCSTGGWNFNEGLNILVSRDCKKKKMWKQDSHIHHIYEFTFRLCLERTMQSFLSNMEIWAKQRYFPNYVAHSGGIGWFTHRAKFSLTTLSRHSPCYIPDVVGTHLCTAYGADLPPFWSGNESLLSPALSTSESFLLRGIVFFLFPAFFGHIYEMSNISCTWAEASKVSSNHRYSSWFAACKLAFRARTNSVPVIWEFKAVP